MKGVLCLMFMFSILLVSQAQGDDIYLRKTSSQIIFGNSKVSLHFRQEDGFLDAIYYAPKKMKIVGNGALSPLDFQIEGKWLYEKLARTESLKGFLIDLEGGWKFALDPEDKGLTEGWEGEAYDAGRWDDFPLPGFWEDKGYTQVFPTSPSPDWKPYNGYAFFRRGILIPEEWRGQPLLLYIGSVDDYDWVYINGHLVGHTGQERENWWEAPRIYEIPPEIVKPGQENTICIRVYDRGGEGGVGGPLFITLKERWERARNPFQMLGYDLNKGEGQATLVIKRGIGDWTIEEEFTLHPQSDLIERGVRITYKGKENPHIYNPRFYLRGVKIGNPSDCFYLIPSNFPPLKYRFEEEGRVVSDNYSGASNRCVILHNSKLRLSFLALFYSETEYANCYVREGKDALDIVHTLEAGDIMRQRNVLEGGKQFLRIVEGDLGQALRKEQEVYDVIGLRTPSDSPEWAKKAIIYSAYPGGTMDGGLGDGGGFDYFSRYLSHLSDLGFNVLWLLPVWPGLYGPLDYFKIEERLGGEEAGRRFVQSAHKLGIKVLFDLIPHGPREESGLLEKMPQVVSRDEKGNIIYWWGCLSCDYAHPDWQRFMAEHATYWVRELDVDGYRVDCAGGGPWNWDPQSPHRPSLSGLWGGLGVLREARNEMRRFKAEVMLLPEASGPWLCRYSDVVYDFPFLFISQTFSLYKPEEWVEWFREWLEYENFAYPKDAVLMRFVESHDTVRFAGLNGIGPFNAFLALCAFIKGAPMVYHDGDVGRGPYLKRIYSLRKKYDVLSSGEAYYLAVKSDQGGIFTCLRKLEKESSSHPSYLQKEDEVAIVAINMTGERKRCKLSVPISLLPPLKEYFLYEAFGEKSLKGERRGDELLIDLELERYSPAVILLRRETPKEEERRKAKTAEVKREAPFLQEREEEIEIENSFYRMVLDRKSGLIRWLSLREGDNWIREMEWAEGQRRIGIGKAFKAGESVVLSSIQRQGEVVNITFRGRGEWLAYEIRYIMDDSERITISHRFTSLRNMGKVKGEMTLWLGLAGVDGWFVNCLEGQLEDVFFVRHAQETKGGRYWHIPRIYEAKRYPLNPYAPYLCAFRKGEYLALRFPPFYQLPENIFISERLGNREGFHFLLAMLDGREGVDMPAGKNFEMSYVLEVGESRPSVEEAESLKYPRIRSDGARYIVETKHYKLVVLRRGGHLKEIEAKGENLLRGGEIYSDKGIFGEFVDPNGASHPLIASSNNDPEADVRLRREGGKVWLSFRSYLRQANTGWGDVAYPLLRYQTTYVFDADSPFIKVQVRVLPPKQPQEAFLAQRWIFQGIEGCEREVGGKRTRIDLNKEGRVWESRLEPLGDGKVILQGHKTRIEIRDVRVEEGYNVFLHNSREGLSLFFAFMDGEVKGKPGERSLSYELGVLPK